MGQRVKVIAFERTNKARIHGRVGHTRTGACTSRGRCFHGWTNRPKKHGK